MTRITLQLDVPDDLAESRALTHDDMTALAICLADTPLTGFIEPGAFYPFGEPGEGWHGNFAAKVEVLP